MKNPVQEKDDEEDDDEEEEEKKVESRNGVDESKNHKLQAVEINDFQKEAVNPGYGPGGNIETKKNGSKNS